MNTFGGRLRLTLWGESHGPAVGAVLDGVPAGLAIDPAAMQADLDRRRPGQGPLVTPRKEEDRVEILAGVFEGKANGAPLSLVIHNTNAKSGDYARYKTKARPGHADFPAQWKYGDARDWRGGGQFSGRLTAPLVAAGAVAKAILAGAGVECVAWLGRVGRIEMPHDRRPRWTPGAPPAETAQQARGLRAATLANPVPCPDANAAADMATEILQAKAARDSVGGLVECAVVNLPAGLGEPFFHNCEGLLSQLLFSVPAVKGVEFGSGFACTALRGSVHNDSFRMAQGRPVTDSNNAGGILGGLTNGMPVEFRVAFKPTSTIAQEQHTVDLAAWEETEIAAAGRHDPCLAVRAVPVVEACAALVFADLALRDWDLVKRWERLLAGDPGARRP